jgi:hypothetical protein
MTNVIAADEMQGGEKFQGKYVVKKQYIVPHECIFVLVLLNHTKSQLLDYK